jgi:hypothetical protein
MTNNQLHGKKFEDLIKSCGLFSGSADGGRSPTATFDIEAKYDKILGLPTSIKSTGSNIVGLSDARSFFANSEKYRMLVGRYKQVGPHKQFHNVHEFILTPETLAKLRGEVLLDDVTAFHDGLLLTAFPVGSHVAARQWALQRKAALADKQSWITLNPKIDSKSQRRLQCSLRLSELIELCAPDGHYHLHEGSIGDLVLPIAQKSSARHLP